MDFSVYVIVAASLEFPAGEVAVSTQSTPPSVPVILACDAGPPVLAIAVTAQPPVTENTTGFPVVDVASTVCELLYILVGPLGAAGQAEPLE
jgi:hypothetical protein